MMDKEQRLKNIEKIIEKNPICLFMKGIKSLPQCGFSAQVVHILDELGVEYETFNVLQDELLREDIKEFSNWPTLPQLYINKEFIGGCDIVTQLYESGELEKLVGQVPSS